MREDVDKKPTCLIIHPSPKEDLLFTTRKKHHSDKEATGEVHVVIFRLDSKYNGLVNLQKTSLYVAEDIVAPRAEPSTLDGC